MRWIAVVLVLALLALVPACEKREQKFGSFKVGAPAPDFVLPDMTGKPVRLSDFRGKVVLLEFWTTWCPPCKLAIPELNDLYTKYKDSNLVILSVSMDEDIGIVKDFMEEYEILFPVLFDDKGIFENFGVYTIPTALVIDEEGMVLEHHMGYAPGIFEELLEKVKDRL